MKSLNIKEISDIIRETFPDGKIPIYDRKLYTCENCGYNTFLPPSLYIRIRRCEQCGETSAFAPLIERRER